MRTNKFSCFKLRIAVVEECDIFQTSDFRVTDGQKMPLAQLLSNCCTFVGDIQERVEAMLELDSRSLCHGKSKEIEINLRKVNTRTSQQA